MTFVCVDDFQKAARRYLPRIFADYIDGGAFSETTMRRNLADFDRIRLRQRVLMPLAEPDLTVRLNSETASLPFGPGPVGFLGLYRHKGDVAVAKAASRHGVPFVLSTFSINGLATIAKASGKAPDFQLYLDQDPEVNAAHLENARRAGVRRIFLTVDTCVTSVRERDVRNGFRTADRLTPGLLWQFAQRPAWSLGVLKGGFPEVELVKGRKEFGRGALAQAGRLSARLEKHLTWETVKSVRRDWGGELIVKGLLDAEDFAMARQTEVDGAVLSNHGGRQLDHAGSTISKVAEARAALGPERLLYVDGGFRRGSDIVKALCLGADFVLLGRPIAWAVAAGGEAAIARLFELLSAEIRITMQLMGCSSVASLRAKGPDYLESELALAPRSTLRCECD